MKKKLYSIILIGVLMMASIYMLINSDLIQKNTTQRKSDNDETKKEESIEVSPSDFPYKISGKCYQNKINDFQLVKPKDSSVVVNGNPDSTSNEKVGVKVVLNKITRNYPSEISLTDKSLEKFDNSSKDSENNFIDNFYYMVIDIEETNLSDVKGHILANDLHYLTIKDNVASDINGLYIEGASKCQNSIYVYDETDDKNYFADYSGSAYVDPNVCIRYKAVYIVPEAIVKDDNLYLTCDLGITADRALLDTSQRYFKIDVNIE